jgi:hypothetical protein
VLQWSVVPFWGAKPPGLDIYHGVDRSDIWKTESYVEKLIFTRACLSTREPPGAALEPHIFVGQAHVSDPHSGPVPRYIHRDVSPTNITPYIYRYHITNEYMIKFVGTDE